MLLQGNCAAQSGEDAGIAGLSTIPRGLEGEEDTRCAREACSRVEAELRQHVCLSSGRLSLRHLMLRYYYAYGGFT